MVLFLFFFFVFVCILQMTKKLQKKVQSSDSLNLQKVSKKITKEKNKSLTSIQNDTLFHIPLRDVNEYFILEQVPTIKPIQFSRPTSSNVNFKSLQEKLKRLQTKQLPCNENVFAFRKKLQQFQLVYQRQQVIRKYESLMAVPNIPPAFKFQYKNKYVIQAKDLQKLSKGEDLNDNLINFYLGFLERQLNHQKKIFVFNSFFFQKLTSCQLKNTKFIERNAESDIQINSRIRDKAKQLQKWTKKKSLFQHQVVLFPLNYPGHWNMLALLNADQLLKPKPQKQTMIVFLDSMGHRYQFAVHALKIYLQQHYLSIYGDNRSFSSIPSRILISPRQVNFHDCGIHLMQNSEMIIRGALDELKIQSENLIKLDLYPRASIILKRAMLQTLLIQMSSNHQQAVRKFIKNSQLILVNEKEQPEYMNFNEEEFSQLNHILLTDQDQEWRKKVRFYYRNDLNYYQ